tara:strand:- start:35099 stop:37531 length:2433 start_codon:yes stop_codon:yes gene_type:complete
MRISLNWLKEYINTDLSVDVISNILTNIGLEVEKITNVQSVKGGLEGIVVGKVISCIKHENADRLKLAKVDIGSEEKLDIVCGAPNIDLGQKVLVATVGTRLYFNDESIKIKKNKIRGVISEGMICSEKEIGVGKHSDGIMVLEDNVKIGTLAKDYFNVKEDIIFEIGLTPNRSDAMSHFGVARDLVAAINCHYSKSDNLNLPTLNNFIVDNNDLPISVEICNPESCHRYSGISISGIIVDESPMWLKNRLISIGLEPINNIVDVTNYIMHDLGQPLHAFDINKIRNNKIKIKKSSKSVNFTTLDGVQRKVNNDDLLICDDIGPLCIAGIMGGIDSGINKETTNVFLESACFDQVSIRKSSKRHSISTDASFRYERGCDPNITIYTLKKAALLIKEIAGGKISSEIIDIYPNKVENNEISFSFENMDKIIGEKLDRKKVISILNDLKINVVNLQEDKLLLHSPTFRIDVIREIDIIEEILRIYGYNNINNPQKFKTSISNNSEINDEEIRNTISVLLSSNGFSEIMNNSLINGKYFDYISTFAHDNGIKLLNPLSQELSYMRPSLIFSGLETINYNINRQNSNLRLYEFGKSYNLKSGKYFETEHLGLFITGFNNFDNWNQENIKNDFFILKESVEHILSRLNIHKFKLEKFSDEIISQGLSYKFNNQLIVNYGEVSAKLSRKFGIKQKVFYADFNWGLIVRLSNIHKVTYLDISKFPNVRRDLSLLIDKEVSFEELLDISFKVDSKILKSVNLFDVYEGKNVPEGKKSYALSFILENKSSTLTDKIIDKLINKLIKSFESKLGAVIRKS